MINQFLICIQGGLGSLFPCPYLLRSLTFFGEEKGEQQKEKKYIIYSPSS